MTQLSAVYLVKIEEELARKQEILTYIEYRIQQGPVEEHDVKLQKFLQQYIRALFARKTWLNALAEQSTRIDSRAENTEEL